MSDKYDQVTESVNKLVKATEMTPDHIRLCRTCYNEFGENMGDAYPQRERDVILTVALGVKVMPTAFDVLCFHCGHGYKMIEELLLYRRKKNIKKKV